MPSWRWALRSPWYLGGTAIAVLAVLYLGSHILSPSTHRTASIRPVPSTSAPARPTVAPSSTPPGATRTPGRAAPSPHAVRPVRFPPAEAALAARFAKAWTDHTVTVKNWRASLYPLITNDLARQLAHALPQTVPATTVTGPPRATVCVSDGCEAVIPTDAGPLAVRIAATRTGGWRVAYLETG